MLAAQIDALDVQGRDIRNGTMRPVSPVALSSDVEAPSSSDDLTPQMPVMPDQPVPRQRGGERQDQPQDDGGTGRGSRQQPQQQEGRGAERSPNRGQADDGESAGSDVTGRNRRQQSDQRTGQDGGEQTIRRPRGGEPAGLIFHHTAGRGTVQGVMNTLRQRGLGIQYIIDREGRIFSTGRGVGQAAHIRAGQGPGRGLSNRNTIGVEVIAHNDADILPVQVEAAKRLARQFPNAQVFGHGEINSHKQRTEGATIVEAVRAERGGARVAGPGARPPDEAAEGGVAGEPGADAGAGGGLAGAAGGRIEAMHSSLMSGLGLTSEQAAGVVGSVMGESGQGLNPNAINRSSGAFGIAQWLGTRRRQLQAFASARGKPASDFDTQVAFLIHESRVNPTERRAVSRLKQARTSAEAAEIWTRMWERPSASEIRHSLPRRQRLASEIERRLKKKD